MPTVQFHTLDEVAEMLGVSIYTIRRLVARGSIRAINVASRRVVSADEIARVAAEGVPPARENKNSNVQ